ncbi:MAG TPA: hypothetical protein VFH50_03895 [Acidimicrobiales bacterium]|nr:hypothetical protein [Acidimicrobiales bacterium]
MRRAGDRFVLVGLATARSTWLARLSQWVTSGSLPGELVRCLTIEEFRATLRSRRVSVALVDEMSRHADRDLLGAVRAAGGTAVVVVGPQPRRDWLALGADACLAEDFELTTLSELLRTRALPVGAFDDAAATAALEQAAPGGRLVAVCGPGGAGASTVACALAQGLAGGVTTGGRKAGRRRNGRDREARTPVALVDLALNGELAVLHGAPPGTPGLPGLVEAHRRGGLDPAALDGFLLAVEERSYLLVTGLRRRRAWSTMRPRALHAAIEGLLRRFPWVVADTDSDAEGEPDSGSLDVEERNAMSRCALGRATAAVVVGHAGVKGAYSLVRTVEDLLEFGVAPDRIVPVVNRCRSGRTERAEVDAALAALLPSGAGHPVVHLPERDVERALVDAAPLPGWLVDPVTAAVQVVADRVGGAGPAADPNETPEPVEPGSLVYWGKAEGALPA